MLFIGTLVLISVSSEKRTVATQESMIIQTLWPEPHLSAEAVYVKIVDGPVLLYHREWKRLAPASLTKIMTALIAYRELASDEQIVFSKDAKETKDPDEKQSAAKTGDSFRRDNALKFALIASDNDAAYALAEAVGKKQQKTELFQERLNVFINLMNKYAKLLGLENSHFQNPSGIDSEEHYMSAEDIEKLSEYIWIRYPALWDMSRTAETTLYSLEGKEYRIENTNILLDEKPAILGSKTGFTDNAKGALVLIYPVRPKNIAIIVILRSQNRFEDGRQIINWLEKVTP